MNRKPIYHKESNKHRLDTIHGGRWQLQYNTGGSHKGQRENDKWKPLARPTDLDTALGQMAARAK